MHIDEDVWLDNPLNMAYAVFYSLPSDQLNVVVSQIDGAQGGVSKTLMSS